MQIYANICTYMQRYILICGADAYISRIPIFEKCWIPLLFIGTLLDYNDTSTGIFIFVYISDVTTNDAWSAKCYLLSRAVGYKQEFAVSS